VLEAAAVLVVSQACAHGALLLAGAPAHGGGRGALALHLALALAAALAAAAVDRALAAALDSLADAVGRLLERLGALVAEHNPRPAAPATPSSRRGLPMGRAPPLAA
jgi:hypothetical protein